MNRNGVPPFPVTLFAVESFASIISSISSNDGIEMVGRRVSIELELAAEVKDDSILA